jgi:uncharacterized protein (DUF362 family)
MTAVHVRRLKAVSAEAVSTAVRELVEVAAVPAAKIGKLSLVKINAMSDEVFPGRNTSPWVLDGVLTALRARYPETRFVIVDTDVAGSRQFGRACVNWGFDRLAQKHGVEIRNLAHEPTEQVAVDNPVVRELSFPRLVRQADSIVNVPVLKTHVLSGISCSLKNHWGLLPRFRYQHHPNLTQVIAEINRQVHQTVLTLIDATVCIEGAGPKTGTPRIVDALLASTDRVSIDSAIVSLIGMPPAMAPHIAQAEAYGVGTTQFTLEGDALPPLNFELPVQSQDLVSLLETRIRKLRVIGELAYHPSVASWLGAVGTQFNKQVWMRAVGRKRRAALLKHEGYRQEYGAL